MHRSLEVIELLGLYQDRRNFENPVTALAVIGVAVVFVFAGAGAGAGVGTDVVVF